MPIFRSTGCVLLHVVFSTRCCDCGPKEPVCSLVLNNICSSTQPLLLKMGIKMPEICRVIYDNYNCCIKLVPHVIFVYDARSHIRGLEL